jgi:hypothetical protein
MASEKKVEAKKDDMVANVEASVEVSQGTNEAVGEPGDGKHVFLDAPGGADAKVVHPKEGKVTDGEVWEEVFPNNATVPTEILSMIPRRLKRPPWGA